MVARRIHLGVAAIALCALSALPARADETPAQSVAEGRFVDHCLGDVQQAVSLYERAIRDGAEDKVLGEAMFGKARALYLAERPGAAEQVLEKLASRRKERAMQPWPRRAETALTKLLAGRDPFARPPRGAGEFTLRASRRPLREVLHDLRKQANVGIALGPSIPEPWTVSVDLVERSLKDLLDHLVGPGYVRKVAEGGYVIGDVARDPAAFRRAFTYAKLRTRGDRELASILRTRRVTLNLPGLDLLKVASLLEKVSGAEVVIGPHALASGVHARAWITDLPLDEALDMVAVPLGLTWTIAGGKILLEERVIEEDDK